MKKIGMIIPNYNQGKFLNDSLAALIGDKKIGEIIVIDDASFDDSVEIISKFKEVKLIQNKRRLGVSGAINAGLEALESEYVMLQGADDISVPGRAEIQEEAIRNSKFSAIIFSQNVVNEKTLYVTIHVLELLI
jgi:glycosyltransferase involved in cell wall biosynthesis